MQRTWIEMPSGRHNQQQTEQGSGRVQPRKRAGNAQVQGNSPTCQDESQSSVEGGMLWLRVLSKIADGSWGLQ